MRDPKRLLLRLLSAAAVAYLFSSVVLGIGLAELQLHPWRRPLLNTQSAAREIETQYHAELQNLEIVASDSVALHAWYVRPQNANGRDILLLHGVGDNREGVGGLALGFLDRGYGVLLPDSRAHGESGGELATYGLRETNDIQRWVTWLYAKQHSRCVYGFGESMGAALVLDSLSQEQRFCAVVAESPFSSFRSVAYERAALYAGAKPWFGRTMLRLPVDIAIGYARLRYGLNFDRDSPINALSHSEIPVLLIHGTEDINILPHHSELIAAKYPSHVVLWEVSGAAHCGASSVEPELFWNKVLTWFDAHSLKQPSSQSVLRGSL